MDTHADGHTDRHTDRHTDGQMDRHTEGQAKGGVPDIPDTSVYNCTTLKTCWDRAVPSSG